MCLFVRIIEKWALCALNNKMMRERAHQEKKIQTDKITHSIYNTINFRINGTLKYTFQSSIGNFHMNLYEIVGHKCRRTIIFNALFQCSYKNRCKTSTNMIVECSWNSVRTHSSSSHRSLDVYIPHLNEYCTNL